MGGGVVICGFCGLPIEAAEPYGTGPGNEHFHKRDCQTSTYAHDHCPCGCGAHVGCFINDEDLRDDSPTSAPTSTPIPYYEDDLVTLYNAKCEDVLGAGLGEFDMVFTSPPYNLGVSAGGGFGHYTDSDGMRRRGGGGLWTGGALAHGYDGHDDAMPLPEYEAWQQSILTMLWARLSEVGAIFYNHKPRVQAGTLWLPLRLNPDLPIRQIITWARAAGMNFAPTHYVPTYEWIIVFAKPAWRLKSKGASGLGDVWRVAAQPSPHPAPFPIALPAGAIESAAPRSVLDPFAGSGSTLVAAKAAGVRAVGIEKSERYCEMAAKRLAQGALNFGGEVA